MFGGLSLPMVTETPSWRCSFVLPMTCYQIPHDRCGATILAIAITNQHPALIDPAVGAFFAAVDAFACKLEYLLLLFD